MKADGKPPVIVTWRGLSGMVSGQEAVSQIEEIAKSDPTASDAQKAAAAAAMGKVLRELQKADSKAGVSVPVLTAPHHGPSSRMQSLVASGENANSVLTPLSTGGLEAKFDTNDWLGWATVAWEKLKHLNPHPMLPPPSVTPEPMPESARIALLGDWATGLYGAPKIAEAVSIDSDPFAMLLHLGDVYYSGTSD